MLQIPRKTLGFKKNMVYEIPPGGEVNHIPPVAYIFLEVKIISIKKRLRIILFNFVYF